MEVFNFLTNRQINPDNIFSANQEMAEIDEDVSGMLRSLESLLEKQIKTWWDVFTFTHYQKEKLIFRSLRWDVPPQDGLEDQCFMIEWLEFFNRVGRELQDLVLTRKQVKLGKLNEQISGIRKKLEPISESSQMKEFNTNMKKKLEKVDRDTQKKKVRKYNRDAADFKNNKIYAWQTPISSTNEAPVQVKGNAKPMNGSKLEPKKTGSKRSDDKHQQGVLGQSNLYPPTQYREEQQRDYYYTPKQPQLMRDEQYLNSNQNEWNGPHMENRNYGGDQYRPQNYGGNQQYSPFKYGEGRSPIPLHNRYLPLDGDYHVPQYHQQGPPPFLGWRGRRGRGGGTPRMDHPRNNREGRKEPQQYANKGMGSFSRGEGVAEQDDGNNPRKRMRDR